MRSVSRTARSDSRAARSERRGGGSEVLHQPHVLDSPSDQASVRRGIFFSPLEKDKRQIACDRAATAPQVGVGDGVGCGGWDGGGIIRTHTAVCAVALWPLHCSMCVLIRLKMCPHSLCQLPTMTGQLSDSASKH
jgi:hypothetical protein